MSHIYTCRAHAKHCSTDFVSTSKSCYLDPHKVDELKSTTLISSSNDTVGPYILKEQRLMNAY